MNDEFYSNLTKVYLWIAGPCLTSGAILLFTVGEPAFPLAAGVAVFGVCFLLFAGSVWLIDSYTYH